MPSFLFCSLCLKGSCSTSTLYANEMSNKDPLTFDPCKPLRVSDPTADDALQGKSDVKA